jgi:hypothetical protein
MRAQDDVARTLADLAKFARLSGDLKAALSSYKDPAIAQEIADERAVAYALAGATHGFVLPKHHVPLRLISGASAASAAPAAYRPTK